MRGNSIIIATSAVFLAETIGDILRDLDIRPVVTAHDGNELTNRIKTSFPRFVLLENCFWEDATEDILQRIIRRYPELRVVVWSAMPVKAAKAAGYIYAGADSYFSMRGEEGDLSEILACIALGRHYYTNEVKEIVERREYKPNNHKNLTRREIEVVKLSVNGWTHKEIAAIIGVKPSTVKMHKLNIYRKLGVSGPVELIRYGLLNSVISLDDLRQN
jgi:two-component system nitrate/nitrite response regulator NarL